MNIALYQVDAFTSALFSGNPAAVCPTNEWLPDETMQQIAMENNLAETAFIVPEGDGYGIRWFTPVLEVDLCGHATLASAWVVFNRLGFPGSSVVFQSRRSGPLTVTRSEDRLTLDFPSDQVNLIEGGTEFSGCFNIEPIRIYRGRTDLLFEFKSEAEIKGLVPDLKKIVSLDARGVIATAAGDEVDVVSRFFGPACGVDEDPVTGSAHTTLIPFWAERLGRDTLRARQLSRRGGELYCRHLGARTEISGNAVLYLEGLITV